MEHQEGARRREQRAGGDKRELGIVAGVEESVQQLKPDLVVVSGDFTQRARTEQFKEACEFLDRLRDAGNEVIGVPGNHDVPLYDVLETTRRGDDNLRTGPKVELLLFH